MHCLISKSSIGRFILLLKLGIILSLMVSSIPSYAAGSQDREHLSGFFNPLRPQEKPLAIQSHSVYRSGLSFTKTLLLSALLPFAQGVTVSGSIVVPGSINPDSTVNTTGAGNYTVLFHPSTPTISLNPYRGNLYLSLDISCNSNNFTGTFTLDPNQAGTFIYNTSGYTTLVPQVSVGRATITTVSMPVGPILFAFVPNPNWSLPPSPGSANNAALSYYVTDGGPFSVTGGLYLDFVFPQTNAPTNSPTRKPTPSGSSTSPGSSQSEGSSSSFGSSSQAAAIATPIVIGIAGLVVTIIYRKCTFNKEETLRRVEYPEVFHINNTLKNEIPNFKEIWSSPEDLHSVNTFVKEVRKLIEDYIKSTNPKLVLGTDAATWYAITSLLQAEFRERYAEDNIWLIAYPREFCCIKCCCLKVRSPLYQFLLKTTDGVQTHINAIAEKYIEQNYKPQAASTDATRSTQESEMKKQVEGSDGTGDDIELAALKKLSKSGSSILEPDTFVDPAEV